MFDQGGEVVLNGLVSTILHGSPVGFSHSLDNLE